MYNTTPTIDDYVELLDALKPKCRWCDYAAPLRIEIEHYDHPGGYRLSGFEEKQWLYVRCKKCSYQWSFQKLGIREISV